MISVGAFPAVHLPKDSETLRFFQKFKDDTILTARVLSKTGARGQLRLLINGKPVSVKSAMDVSVGQEIRLSLTHEKNGISLRMLSSGAAQETGKPSSLSSLSGSFSGAAEQQQPPQDPLSSVGKLSSALFKALGHSPLHSEKSVLLRMVPGTQGDSLLPQGEKSMVAEARVLTRPAADGLAKILIKGQEVFVKTDENFTPGQQIRVRLGRENTGIRMEVLPPENIQAGKDASPGIGKFQEMAALWDESPSLPLSGKRASDVLLATSLSRARNLSRLFSGKEASLEKIFSALALKSDMPDKDFLPKLVSFGGLLFEKKMASVLETRGIGSFREMLPLIIQQDAKGLALKALQQALEKDASNPSASARTGFPDTMESVQIVNSHSSESGRYFLPFPIADPQGFRLGQLFVDLGGKKDKDKGENRKNIKIAFLLDMSNMGHIRADFSILDRAITGRFLFENAQACEYAHSMIPQLREGLARAGFHAAGIDCVLATPKDMDPGVFMDACIEPFSDSEVHIVL